MVFDFIGNIAQLHPAASFAIKLEVQHQENDVHIAVVHGKMAKTVFHLRFLNQIPAEEEKSLEQGMHVLFRGMAETIRKFGEFVNAYHNHQWQKATKFFFAHAHKSKLEEFDQQFQQHKEEMEDMYKSSAHVQLLKISDDTSEILRRLRILDPETEAAQKIVAQHGGNVNEAMKDPKIVEQVAATFKERATFSMKNVLADGFHALLDRHQRRYEMKYRTLENLVTDSQSLLAIVQDGPHEVIQDKEFREIWQSWSNPQWFAFWACGWYNNNAWYFHEIDSMMQDLAEDLHGHRPMTPIDSWSTMKNILASIKPLILVADVEDVSGVVHGMPRQLSQLQTEYREFEEAAIQDALRQHGVHLTDKGSIMAVVKDTRIELHMMPLLYVLTKCHDPCRTSAGFRFGTPTGLPPDIRQLPSALPIASPKSSPLVPYAIGPSRLPLNSASPSDGTRPNTKRLSKLVKKVLAQARIHHDEACEIEEIAISCITIFVAYDHRLRDLSRGWRFEAKDIAMQVDRYADGLFKKYYTKPWEYHTAYKNLRHYLFGHESVLPLHLTPVIRTQHSAPTDDVDKLAKHVQELEARVLADQNEATARVQELEERVAKQEQHMAALHDTLFDVLFRRLRGVWRFTKRVPVHTIPAQTT
ncbi:hypothetical protein C8Q77DRAFT_1153356 [Trametes polyzona]|nr:hypothetical protein C8Q77DRAFT_1153356 [Trametes polyzona]